MDRHVTLSVRWLVVAAVAAVALVAAYLVGRAGPAPADAATTGPDAGAATRTITVTGVGHVSVVPDQLGFQVSVSVLRDDLDQALSDAGASLRGVVDAVTAQGVPEKDVQTTDVETYPEYSNAKGQPQTLRGYRVSETLSVTVDDLAKGSSVVSAALAAGGEGVQLDGLQLQVADPDGATDPARADAVDQAEAKAKQYAADAGLTLGDVVRISETADQPYEQDVRASYDAAAGSVPAPSVPIQAGQEDLTAQVTVVYAVS